MDTIASATRVQCEATGMKADTTHHTTKQSTPITANRATMWIAFYLIYVCLSLMCLYLPADLVS